MQCSTSVYYVTKSDLYTLMRDSLLEKESSSFSYNYEILKLQLKISLIFPE